MASHGLLAVMLSGELNSGTPRARRRAAVYACQYARRRSGSRNGINVHVAVVDRGPELVGAFLRAQVDLAIRAVQQEHPPAGALHGVAAKGRFGRPRIE
jgi:hypothetical protein